MVTFVKQSIFLKNLQFRRGWAYLDAVIIVTNTVITMSLFTDISIIDLRIIEAILIVAILAKSLYFLRLIGEIAPLVDIIFKILGDIKYFVAIFGISLFAFVLAFLAIGKNQEHLALLDGDEDAIPGYATLMGSINHVYTASLGEFDTDSYFGHDMEPYCVILFFGLSFFMCLHMLNMLIAIMGDSFSSNKEHREANVKMSQLAFVVDNWWTQPI